MPTLSTAAELTGHITTLGLKRKYKPYRDIEADKILLETRRPPAFADGLMSGSEIDIYDDSTVRVWTSQKKKAADVARVNGFKVRLLDGEAELYIPMNRADEFLHSFGAKVKSTNKPPVLTPEQRAKGLAALAVYRAAKKAAELLVANASNLPAQMSVERSPSNPEPQIVS